MDSYVEHQEMRVAFATKHGKETQVAPVLARFGLQVRVVAVDTDAQVYERALVLRGEVTLASDARAHCNPSRQRVITACAEQLARSWAAQWLPVRARARSARAG
jgi:hypothetical protein